MTIYISKKGSSFKMYIHQTILKQMCHGFHKHISNTTVFNIDNK